jgi:hypothetical protein
MPNAASSGFELWKQGVDRAPGDPRWSRHDCALLSTIAAFQLHLSGTPGWQPIDPAWVKAMLWVETGAGSPQWNTKPLQIGVLGDAGLGALLSGREGGDEVLPPGLKSRLSVAAVRSIPERNIAAGVGYLLLRMAIYEFHSLPMPGAAITGYTVREGDGFERIARSQASTTEWLKKLNPGVGLLRPGVTIRIQRAEIRREIVRWRSLNAMLLRERYNGDRDERYAEKIEYALRLVRTDGVNPCALR